MRIKIAIFISICVVFSAQARSDLAFFTIGTGGITGVYYSAGNAICKLVNQGFRKHRMRCAVEVTAASIFNLKAVRDDSLKFGMVQAGIHYEAYTAQGPFKDDAPYTSLRSLFSLHDEIFTILAAPDSGIDDMTDLKNKRVNVGIEGSGTRKGALELLSFAGFKPSEFAALTNLKPDQTTEALCASEIDAYIYMVGHPAQNTKESTTRCSAKIVGIDSKRVPALDEVPYYQKSIIEGGMYPHNPHTIHTYSVKATLVSDSRVDEDIVYHLVKSVFEKIDRFKTMHPAFANLSVQSMIKDGLTAPLHKGAERYYKEVGLIK